MQEIASYPDVEPDDALRFLAKLIRFQRDLFEMGQQLDRIGTELREALNERARERFEEYR